MVAFGFLTRSWFDSEQLPELLSNAILRFMPIQMFSAALTLFGGWAKPILLGSVIIGIVSVGALIARFDGLALSEMTVSARMRRTIGLTVSVWVPLALFGLIVSPLGIVFFATNSDLLALELSSPGGRHHLCAWAVLARSTHLRKVSICRLMQWTYRPTARAGDA